MDVKSKVWIVDEEDNLIFGDGKMKILELIEETGSIQEAAKKADMNYKKAWSHIKILQENIEDELVVTAKGRTTGGTRLTPKAKELVAVYKILKEEVKTFTKERYEMLFREQELIVSVKKGSDDQVK